MYSQFGAYQKWCRTTSQRAQFYEKNLEMVDLIDDSDLPRAGKHRELEKAEIKKSEDAVQRVLTAVINFTNPFTVVDQEKLYCIASGAPVSLDVEKDVMQAESVGKALKLTSSKDYRAENQEASLTLSRRRNSRRWRPATRNSRSHPQRDR